MKTIKVKSNVDGICTVCGVSTVGQEPVVLFKYPNGSDVFTDRLCKNHSDYLKSKAELEQKEGVKNTSIKLRLIAEDSKGVVIREVVGNSTLDLLNGYFPNIFEEDVQSVVNEFLETREVREKSGLTKP